MTLGLREAYRSRGRGASGNGLDATLDVRPLRGCTEGQDGLFRRQLEAET